MSQIGYKIQDFDSFYSMKDFLILIIDYCGRKKKRRDPRFWSTLGGKFGFVSEEVATNKRRVPLLCIMHRGKKGRSSVLWKNLTGVPPQPSSTECGYFMMRYMRDIIEDKDLSFVHKWERRSNCMYSQEDIDVIQNEWAKFVVKSYVGAIKLVEGEGNLFSYIC